MFQCFKKGKELRDLTTGEILGSREKAVGSIKITTVLARHSEAAVLEDNGITQGCVLRGASAKSGGVSGIAAAPVVAAPSSGAASGAVVSEADQMYDDAMALMGTLNPLKRGKSQKIAAGMLKRIIAEYPGSACSSRAIKVPSSALLASSDKSLAGSSAALLALIAANCSTSMSTRS